MKTLIERIVRQTINENYFRDEDDLTANHDSFYTPYSGSGENNSRWKYTLEQYNATIKGNNYPMDYDSLTPAQHTLINNLLSDILPRMLQLSEKIYNEYVHDISLKEVGREPRDCVMYVVERFPRVLALGNIKFKKNPELVLGYIFKSVQMQTIRLIGNDINHFKPGNYGQLPRSYQPQMEEMIEFDANDTDVAEFLHYAQTNWDVLVKRYPAMSNCKPILDIMAKIYDYTISHPGEKVSVSQKQLYKSCGGKEGLGMSEKTFNNRWSELTTIYIPKLMNQYKSTSTVAEYHNYGHNVAITRIVNEVIGRMLVNINY